MIFFVKPTSIHPYITSSDNRYFYADYLNLTFFLIAYLSK